MEKQPTFSSVAHDNFQHCFSKLTSISFNERDATKTDINILLDELIYIDYSRVFTSVEAYNQLIKTLCHLVPFNQTLLVIKVLRAVQAIVAKRQFTLSDTSLKESIQLSLDAIHQCELSVRDVALYTLATLLYDTSNTSHSHLHETLLGDGGLLLKLYAESTDNDETMCNVVMCMENMCVKATNHDYLSSAHIANCRDTFLEVLQSVKPTTPYTITRSRVMASCLRGLGNIVTATRQMPTDQLGTMLAICRAYMVYGLTNKPCQVPDKLQPAFHIPESKTEEKPPPTKTSESQDRKKQKRRKPNKRGNSAAQGGMSSFERMSPRDTQYSDACNTLVSDGMNSRIMQTYDWTSTRNVQSSVSVSSESSNVVKSNSNDGSKSRNVHSSDSGYISKASDGSNASKSESSVESNASKSESSDNTNARKSQSSDGTSSSKSETSDGQSASKPQSSDEPTVSKSISSDGQTALKSSSNDEPSASKSSDSTNACKSQSSDGSIARGSPSEACSLLDAPEASDGLSDWNCGPSSESEYSDSEGGQSNKLRSMTERVRQSALVYLHTILKNTERKVMFGYWTSFLPSVPITNQPDTHTLMTVILNDSSPKCRLGALVTLSFLMYGSKQLLVAAEYSPNPTQAFMTFSQTLGCIIHELHKYLINALVAENFPRIITQIIKCLSIVVANAPYSRLKPGLLNKVVSKVRHFIHHRDINVRVACLSCFGSMCSTPPLLEVHHILQSPVPPMTGVKSYTEGSGVTSVGGTPEGRGSSGRGTFSGSLTPIHPTTTSDTSWVLKLCTKHIQPANDDLSYEPLPVKLESLQVLTSLCKNYFNIVRNEFDKLSSLIHTCLIDPDPSVQLHAAKLLTEKGQSILHDEAMQADIEAAQLRQLWEMYLDGPVISLLQSHDTKYDVKAALCDCLSMIGPVFAALPNHKQMLCMTICLAMVHEPDPVLRASAVRTLGVYCLFPCLTQDISFLLDCTTAILECLSDRIVSVRIKAAWSLGNLSDTLIANKDNGIEEFVADYPDTLLLELIKAGTRASLDSEKVKYNAVRAVGNLLKYVSCTSIANVHQSEVLRQCVNALTKSVNCGCMKVRWNACYGITSLLKNSQLLPYVSKENMMTNIFDALLTAIRDCKNFKVKIGATSALMAPQTRSVYGSPVLFVSVWTGLIDCLVTAEDILDFIEFRYRDSLLQQVCETILHLTSLATPPDLTPLSQLSLIKWQTIYEYMNKWMLMQPVKEEVPEVEVNLSSLASQSLDDQQREGLQCLSHLYLIYTTEPQAASDNQEKTAFSQTYD